MHLSLPLEDFKTYVSQQLNNLFPDNLKVDKGCISLAFDLAIQRTEFCFKYVNIKSYSHDNKTYLNHLHSDQYAVFLWFLSNTVWEKTSDERLASKLFYMNKVLNGLNCMYDTELPRIFLLLHVVGTVLGRAKYSDFFVAAQGCTVGAQNGVYPSIGKAVAMLPHSSIIGECVIGDRVSVGINAKITKQDIASDKIVYVDCNGNSVCRKANRPWAETVFNIK
ncbi:MAG TPA: hypothetical protein DCP36_12185 [Sporomusaceae bacterium]|nr:hypothetical protein [Sporomusaceae bacterium]